MLNFLGLLGCFVIFAIVMFGIMYVFGKCFDLDLKEIKKTDPAYRKYLNDKYDI